jgi:hypothetical protein
MTAADVVQLMRLDAQLQGLTMADLVIGKYPELDSIIKSCIVLPDGVGVLDVPASGIIAIAKAFKEVGGNADFFRMAGLVNVLLGLSEAASGHLPEESTT